MTRRARALYAGTAFVFAVTLALAQLAVFSPKAQAADFWRGVRNVGYFNCLFKLTATHYDSPSGHGKVIPMSVWRDGVVGREMRSTQDFITRLQQAYDKGGQNKTGAAFLVKAMLGYEFCPGGDKAPSTNRTVSAAQWDDLSRRLGALEAQGKIDWMHKGYQASTTSLGSDKFVGNWDGVRYNLGHDVAAVNFAQTDDAIVIDTPGAGSVVIFYTCGNPPADKIAELPKSDFNLEPTITVSPSLGESGGTVGISPSVNNSGKTDSTEAEWRVTTFNVASDGAVPSDPVTSASEPLTHFTNSTTVVASSEVFGTGSTEVGARTLTIPEVAVGTRICYALSVQPYRHDNAQWRHSAPACLVVAKKPKVQILGNDLVVGKGQVSAVQTSTSVKLVNGSNRTYGSWGEYAVIASGLVTGMASGAGYSLGATSPDFCLASLLTFANAGATGDCTGSTSKGFYTVDRTLPTVSTRFQATDALSNGATLDVATVTERIYSGDDTLSIIAGGDVGKGRWVVINAPDTAVTIRSDIRYSNEQLQTMADIPQVVIIADTITIDAGVGRVDAWLIATGTTGSINTCRGIVDPASSTSPLTAGRCSSALVVNGPVMARHLYLYRTAGAGNGVATGTPAEIFNLRPDAYLWATYYNASAGRLPTISTQELPPRF